MSAAQRSFMQALFTQTSFLRRGLAAGALLGLLMTPAACRSGAGSGSGAGSASSGAARSTGTAVTAVTAATSAVDSAVDSAGGQAVTATGGIRTAQSAAPGEPTSAAGIPAQIAIASSDIAVGHERFAFAILDANNALVPSATATVKFYRLKGETTEPATGVLPVTFYPFALAEAGLYVVYTDFDQPGPWGAEIAIKLPDGRAAPEQRVRFLVAGKTKSVAVGEPAPPTHNRTLKTEPDLAKLSSDLKPDPDFYRLTVEEAVKTGKPTVVVFATPAYCQSKTCGPTLDEVKKAKAVWGAKVNFIHIEVYKSFEPLVYADEMARWGLETEPWVFVLDKQGRVIERLEGSVTDAELERLFAKDLPGL